MKKDPTPYASMAGWPVPKRFWASPKSEFG